MTAATARPATSPTLPLVEVPVEVLPDAGQRLREACAALREKGREAFITGRIERANEVLVGLNVKIVQTSDHTLDLVSSARVDAEIGHHGSPSIGADRESASPIVGDATGSISPSEPVAPSFDDYAGTEACS